MTKKKREPEYQAARKIINEWRDAASERDAEEINGEFLRDALLVMFESILMLDEKVHHLGQIEWRAADTINAYQEELNMMRYKMIQFQDWAKSFKPSCQSSSDDTYSQEAAS